ncbi:hypothetical protein, variant 1 [Aphanomyces astaci]|uniref:Uncharacterized protein n=1 Tax=Aphanomyces astaci TaxID=112090 RepID=W4GAU6_APHAT|nr:hypothetical protein, variant 1 [Aphanomyces astaci]ETV76421.1 hypothetical protein, variant 1 [Aphanomyces astaci]|eukprot:XP_009833967.1 hypothetical protein, variant 1 [Aphanomyces astaci]
MPKVTMAKPKTIKAAPVSDVEASSVVTALVVSKEEAEAARLALQQLQLAEIDRQRMLYQVQDERQRMVAAEVESHYLLLGHALTSRANSMGAADAFRHRVVSALWLGVVCDCPYNKDSLQWGFHGATVLSVVMSVLVGETKSPDLNGIHAGFGALFSQWHRHGVLAASGQPPVLSTYEAVEIAHLLETPATTETSVPHDTLLSRALALVLLHAVAPRRAMDLAMAVAKNSPPETRDVVRYLSMLVLGSVQNTTKEALLRPYFIAHGFPSDFWTTDPPCAPVRRVISMLPTVQVPAAYFPNAHVVTSFHVILSVFGTTSSISDGLRNLDEYQHPHSAVATSLGILWGATYGNAKDTSHDPHTYINTDKPIILEDLLHVIIQHGYVYALRVKNTTASRQTLTPALEIAWSLYAAASKAFHPIATRAHDTIRSMDPCSIEDVEAIRRQSPGNMDMELRPYNAPPDMAAEVADFWVIYASRVATLVPPPPQPVIIPPPLTLEQPSTSGNLLAETKVDTSMAKAGHGVAKSPSDKAVANAQTSPGRGSPPRPPSPQTTKKASTKRSKKALVLTPDEIARQELRLTFTDRYAHVREAIQVHFATLLSTLTGQVNAAFRRHDAVDTWASRSAMATALLAHQDQLQQLHEKLQGEEGSHHLSKATMADMCNLSSLLTLKTNICRPDTIHNTYF